MEEPKKVGYKLPWAVIAGMEATRRDLGKLNQREKWIIVSAAFLQFMESPEMVKQEYIRRLKTADTPGESLTTLVERALAKGGVSFQNLTGSDADEADDAEEENGSNGGTKKRRTPRPRKPPAKGAGQE